MCGPWEEQCPGWCRGAARVASASPPKTVSTRCPSRMKRHPLTCLITHLSSFRYKGVLFKDTFAMPWGQEQMKHEKVVYSIYHNCRFRSKVTLGKKKAIKFFETSPAPFPACILHQQLLQLITSSNYHCLAPCLNWLKHSAGYWIQTTIPAPSPTICTPSWKAGDGVEREGK